MSRHSQAFAGEHIWIIGASSGIGAALAVSLAQQGATLILSSRREQPLQQLNQRLGGHHLVLPLDVAVPAHIAAAVAKVQESVVRLDRVVFMDAIYQPNSIRRMDITFAQQSMQTNLIAAMALTQALLPVFEQQAQPPAQPKSQLLLCASVAGYAGLPNGQPYSATKAALINFAESLYSEEKSIVDVKIINPGFVKTPMTDKNTFPMPMCITPEQAAVAISQGMQQRHFEIHFPKRLTVLLKLLRLLPYRVYFRLTGRMASTQ